MLVILVLQNILTLAVNLADNIMLGGYSELALSGVAAVNQIQVIYQQLLQAVAEAIVILGSQYFGKHQLEPIKTLSAQAMRFGAVICIILFGLVSLFPEQVLYIFTSDQAIIVEGCGYLQIVRFTYFFFFVTQILLGMLRSVGIVKIALVLSVSTLCINCGINWVLIYGRFGAPEMGASGAAVGTLIARIIEVIIIVIFVAKQKSGLHMRLRDFLLRDRDLRKDYTKVLIPIILVNGLWGFNMAAQNAILGHMTSRAIAANSVANTLYTIMKSGAVGSASAAAFFTGKIVGEGDFSKLKAYKNTMQLLFIGIGIVTAISLFFIRIPILSLYQLSPETRELANTFLLILSVTAIGTAYQMPTNLGVIRGGGSPQFSMKLDLISIWCVVIPLSAILAFGFKASPILVMWALNCDQFFKAVPIFIKTNFGTWAKSLTREKAAE